MIERYLHREIAKIWEEKAKYAYFLQAELVLLKHLEAEGIIPNKTADSFSNACINLKRIHEIENVTRHDVVAFCESITEQVDPQFSKYFHFGVTSSDIIDTALSLQLRDSIKITVSNLKEVLVTLKNIANNTSDIICVGRSHGVYAEPMIFGSKFLSFYAELKRRIIELKDFDENLTGQFSGAVGNYSIVTPKLERNILNELNLKVEDISTQVIPRDHLVKLAHIFSRIACAIERIAIEIRHLHHEDINEMHEGFKENQKGSSVMPHKKNPIACENLTGIARIIRSYSSVAEQNCLLWHERDISHSSSERIYLQDMFGYTNYAFNRLNSTLESLTFNKENIEKKVNENPKILSSYFLHLLIIHSDLTREDAYQKIQECAFSKDPLKLFQKLFESFHIKFELKDLALIKAFYQKSFNLKKDQLFKGDL